MRLSDLFVVSGLVALHFAIFAGEQGVLLLVIWGLASLIYYSLKS